MALNAQFAATPIIGSALLTTADSTLTGNPAAVSSSIVTGGTLGTRISKIIIRATSSGNYGASIVRLWIFDGANHRLFYEATLPATTQSASNPGSSITLSEAGNFDVLPLMLSNGYSIRASISASSPTATVIIFGAHV